MDHPLHYCGNSFFDWSIRTHLDSSENLSRLIDEPILLTLFFKPYFSVDFPPLL